MSDQVHTSKQGSKQKLGRPPAQALEVGTLRPGDPRMLETQVYNLLRRALMKGAIGAGTAFSTRTLADRLGISPMPVRGALKRLEGEGVLQAHARSGYRVAPIDAPEYVEIIQIRARLEGMATALAATRITGRELDRLRRWNAALAQPGVSGQRFLRRNHGFHFELYAAAHSPILLQNIEMYWVRIGPILYSSLNGYDQARVVRTHGAIIEALADHDPVRAEEMVRSDLMSACGPVIDALSQAAPPISAISY
ncbi:GntR family transcriptional regulator [Boseongicola sp. H5]|uniref:GntR family transcriptional regulator n=1 Tax=Boseongicola sp. H5 TaxID=2763261 RepID=UPI001D0B3B72|nr:GntR family transcriptional regulator [Boseongicola sp. H5]